MIMEFWKGNKVDGRFEMPVAEVAAQYMAWANSQGVEADHLQGLPIERSLRWWLTSPEHFNAVWVDETESPESFWGLFDAVHDLIYPRS
jgi:hypothetical protein